MWCFHVVHQSTVWIKGFCLSTLIYTHTFFHKRVLVPYLVLTFSWHRRYPFFRQAGRTWRNSNKWGLAYDETQPRTKSCAFEEQKFMVTRQNFAITVGQLWRFKKYAAPAHPSFFGYSIRIWLLKEKACDRASCLSFELGWRLRQVCVPNQNSRCLPCPIDAFWLWFAPSHVFKTAKRG